MDGIRAESAHAIEQFGVTTGTKPQKGQQDDASRSSEPDYQRKSVRSERAASNGSAQRHQTVDELDAGVCSAVNVRSRRVCGGLDAKINSFSDVRHDVPRNGR